METCHGESPNEKKIRLKGSDHQSEADQEVSSDTARGWFLNQAKTERHRHRLHTCGLANILFTPSTKCERNFARSALLKRDLRTEAIWTRHDNTCTHQHNRITAPLWGPMDAALVPDRGERIALTNGERDGGMEWYKLKKSCSVEESRNAARKRKRRRRAALKT